MCVCVLALPDKYHAHLKGYNLAVNRAKLPLTMEPDEPTSRWVVHPNGLDWVCFIEGTTNAIALIWTGEFTREKALLPNSEHLYASKVFAVQLQKELHVGIHNIIDKMRVQLKENETSLASISEFKTDIKKLNTEVDSLRKENKRAYQMYDEAQGKWLNAKVSLLSNYPPLPPLVSLPSNLGNDRCCAWAHAGRSMVMEGESGATL